MSVDSSFRSLGIPPLAPDEGEAVHTPHCPPRPSEESAERQVEACLGLTGTSDKGQKSPPPKEHPPAPTQPYPAPGVSSQAAAIPGRVANYQILGVLGRGGMGIVYKAKQPQLGRIVALKMILSGAHAQEGEHFRFRRETESIARLQHPNIVQIYEVGEHEGKPFFSMELCAGGRLDQELAAGILAPVQAASLVEQLARAVHVVHQKGVLHRDLKPSNVLFSEDGTPKLTDFGLAKNIGEAGKTVTGEVLGTPSYMAPEQAGGRNREVGPACDVYSLGAILYQCLTGRPPFKGPTVAYTLFQVMTEEPVPPRKVNPAVPPDLEAICLKCMRKDPGERYDTALALAQDLEWFLASDAAEPVRPTHAPVGIVGWLWNNKGAIASLAVAVMTLLVGIFATFQEAPRLNQPQQAAEEQTALNKNASEPPPSLPDAPSTETPPEARPPEAPPQAPPSEKQPPPATDEQTPSQQNSASKEDVPPDPTGPEPVPPQPEEPQQQPKEESNGGDELPRESGPVNTFPDRAETRDSKQPADTNRELPKQPPPDAEPPPPKKPAHPWVGFALKDSLQGHAGGVVCLAASADGKLIASGASDKSIRVWDARTGVNLLTIKESGEVMGVSFSPDGKYILAGSTDITVKVWDAQTGQLVLPLRGHRGIVYAVCYSPDGRLIATGGGDRLVKVWDAQTGQELLSLEGHTSQVSGVAFSADGRRIVSGSFDKTVKVWDPATGEQVLSFEAHPRMVTGVSFSPDARYILSTSLDKTLKLWDADNGALVNTLTGHDRMVTTGCFSPDSKYVVSGSADAKLMVWDVATGRSLVRLTGHEKGVSAVRVSPDGKRIISASGDTKVGIWGGPDDQ